MKIAILNIYQNKVNRGVETFVAELSKRLTNNHEVDVISNVNYLKILKSKYDLVIPTNGRWQAVLIKIMSFIAGYKIIISGQSGIGLDDRINLYTFPDYFIVLSDYALNWARKINSFVKSVKIANGVDVSKFKIQKSKFKRLKNKFKIVLAVGAFSENKRHDLTIKAVAKLKNIKLIIAGGGGDQKQEICDLGFKILGKDRFQIVQTSNDKMPEVYKIADLLVFPTVSWESFGITLVEAMACNLPVVANNDPIRREIVGDAGLFVDPTDSSEYANSIKNALDTDWKDKPRKQAEKFDWDEIAKKYEKIINTL